MWLPILVRLKDKMDMSSDMPLHVFMPSLSIISWPLLLIFYLVGTLNVRIKRYAKGVVLFGLSLLTVVIPLCAASIEYLLGSGQLRNMESILGITAYVSFYFLFMLFPILAIYLFARLIIFLKNKRNSQGTI
jgi:hypothetical protein